MKPTPDLQTGADVKADEAVAPAPENDGGARPASKNALVSAKISMRLEMVVNGIPVHFPLKQELTQVPWNDVVTAAGKLVEKCDPTVRKLMDDG